MFYMHNFGWGWWLIMSIGMIAFWGLVIYGIVWLVRGDQSTQQRQEAPPQSPTEILKLRLARGEISIDEYRRLADALEHESPEAKQAA